MLEYKETTIDKLVRLNNRLTEIDHMVAECYECSLLGIELPYDITAIHQERKAIKAEIKLLQSE